VSKHLFVHQDDRRCVIALQVLKVLPCHFTAGLADDNPVWNELRQLVFWVHAVGAIPFLAVEDFVLQHWSICSLPLPIGERLPIDFGGVVQFNPGRQ
jgi:hypothetical protein